MDKTIQKAWTYVAVEPDGTEEIIGIETDKGECLMMGVDLDTSAALAPEAQELANTHGWRIKLLEFSTRREVREFLPQRAESFKRKHRGIEQ